MSHFPALPAISLALWIIIREAAVVLVSSFSIWGFYLIERKVRRLSCFSAQATLLVLASEN